MVIKGGKGYHLMAKLKEVLHFLTNVVNQIPAKFLTASFSPDLNYLLEQS